MKIAVLGAGSVFVLAVAIGFTFTVGASADPGGKPWRVPYLMVMPYDTGLYAAWGAPEKDGEPKRYLIQARKEGGTIHRKWVTADTMGHSFECLDDGEYRVRVRAGSGGAHNAVGFGAVPVTESRAAMP